MTMKIATSVVLITLFFPLLLSGQRETSNWYFGNGAGITFNNDGSITALTDGNIDTIEGCATISDIYGNLLFYTDGITVYNQDHLIMENGNDLLGDPSSTQSALIVPNPGDPSIFYIFTVDTKISEEDGDEDKGLNYSTVDISLNGGKGEITQKNMPLLVDCSEKITAIVKNCSEQSIWLITLASADGLGKTFNTYHAFEIKTSGVIQPSVKSTFNNLNIGDSRGYLKISPNGTKLAVANMSDGLFIYNFDAISGNVSNQEMINISGSNHAPYGIEFSSNNQYLYTHVSNDIVSETGNSSSLLQFDLTAVDISNSQVILDKRELFRGALQLGNNGKIYRTNALHYFQGTPFLSVINNPNQKGLAANYQHKAISLNGRNSTQGLPPFIQSFFNTEQLIKNQDNTTSSAIELCTGETITLQVDGLPGASYSWEKNGIALIGTENFLEIPMAESSDSGLYRLTIDTNNPADCLIYGEATVYVAPPPSTDIIYIEQCDIDSNTTDGITLIDLTQAIIQEEIEIIFYETQIDIENDTPLVNNKEYRNTHAFNQTIFYKVTNKIGCSDFGEVKLKVNSSTLNPSSFDALITCDNAMEENTVIGTFDLSEIRRDQYSNLDVMFYSNLKDASFRENALGDSFTSTSSTIYARGENTICKGVESIELIVMPLPQLELDDSYIVCTDGEPLILNAPYGLDSYSWYIYKNNTQQKIGSTQQIVITEVGNYTLEVKADYISNDKITSCSTSTTFNVTESNRAIFDAIVIKDFSTNNTISVFTLGDGDYEYSLDGITYQDNSLFENIAPGFYTLYARDKKGCGITEEEITAIGYPKYFTPNADGINDTWGIRGLSKDLLVGDISIYDRYGKLIKHINSIEKGWDGTANGQDLPASDYWFQISITEGKQIRGHFTLKR